MKTIVLNVDGISCGHCVNAVTNILKSLKGVAEVKVETTGQAKVTFDENQTSESEMINAINASEIYIVK
ncbi:MAG: heavy-metal-associated domain-containing protein [Vicingaceae bacterium]